MNEFIYNYTQDLKKSLDNLDKPLIDSVINKIFETYKSNKQIFIIGNGGSASTASHFACDLSKGTIIHEKPRFRAISLNDNMALVTAFSNDYDYKYIFSEQLATLLNEDDLLIAISASGNSKNIIEAINYAKTKSVFVIGFSGFDGGYLKQASDLCIHVENSNYGQVEDVHMYLCHVISQNIKKYIEEL